MPPADPLFLGIDLGTSGCRICLVDSRGEPQHQQQTPLPESRIITGHRCQEPRHWWHALETLLQALPAEKSRIAALAVDGTSASVLPLDRHHRTLGPALMYNDDANRQAAEAIARLAPPDSPARGASSALAKLLTLRQRHGRQLRHVVTQADWIAGRLAGRYDFTDENNALKLGYDPLTRSWPDWLKTLYATSLLPPRVLEPGSPAARLATTMAHRFGLPDDLMIVAGTTDSIAATLASGAGEVADAVTSLGSSLAIKLFSKRPVFAAEYGVYSHRLGRHWLVGGASNSGGAVLRQFFTDEDMRALTPRLRPECPTGLDYYPLPATGERFPVNDPRLTPRIHPRPNDPVVFFQALLEGIAAIETRAYRLLQQLGAPYPRRVFTSGGGASNPAWQIIRRRALGVEVLPARQQQAAYGAALLARQGFLTQHQETQ